MNITLTMDAQSFLKEKNATALTIASVVFSSCCSGPLPPEAKPGAPNDTDGFDLFHAGEIAVYFDTLLDPRPSITVDLKDYSAYRELFIVGWE